MTTAGATSPEVTRLCSTRVPCLPDLRLGRTPQQLGKCCGKNFTIKETLGTPHYAAVPQLVRIYRERGPVDWNTYALVAIIESARTERENPKVPEWLEKDYFDALRELAKIGMSDILRTKEPQAVRAILSVVAIANGLRTHGRFLIQYSEDELLNLESGE